MRVCIHLSKKRHALPDDSDNYFWDWVGVCTRPAGILRWLCLRLGVRARPAGLLRYFCFEIARVRTTSRTTQIICFEIGRVRTTCRTTHRTPPRTHPLVHFHTGGDGLRLLQAFNALSAHMYRTSSIRTLGMGRGVAFDTCELLLLIRAFNCALGTLYDMWQGSHISKRPPESKVLHGLYKRLS